SFIARSGAMCNVRNGRHHRQGGAWGGLLWWAEAQAQFSSRIRPLQVLRRQKNDSPDRNTPIGGERSISPAIEAGVVLAGSSTRRRLSSFRRHPAGGRRR